MIDYRVPLDDIQFALGCSDSLAGVDDDLVAAVLAEAARFAEQALAPLHAVGDQHGCQLDGTDVRTPPGFAAAYRQFCEAGWPALAQDDEFGGQGLPLALHFAVYEMLTGANLAWALYPTITWGSIATLSAHGTQAQKQLYLPPMISGEWTGTMCLTESQAGSDLGLLRTRAEPLGDGRYAISGTKIFISSGEQDFTDNIIHLTLARLPDAPAGTGGISLFVVPKVMPDGRRNALSCGGIEEKMGIHGSPTCTMNFDGAEGYLLGQPNRGLAAMFTLINESRIEVCLQAQGQMERAYQASLAYASERRQMRAAPRHEPDQPADCIIAHPEIQRLLLTQRCHSEAARLFSYELASLLQRSRHEGDDEAERRLALLTPIAKGFISEMAQEATSHAIQVYGGHGFITESGVEQLYRDVRITAIYEGTTAIQGVDLITRKLMPDQGEAFEAWCAHMTSKLDEQHPLAAPVMQAIERWREISRYLTQRAGAEPGAVNLSAVNYLLYGGYVVSAWYLLVAAQREVEPGGQRRAESAEFYIHHILPRIQSLDAILRGPMIENFSPLQEAL